MECEKIEFHPTNLAVYTLIYFILNKTKQSDDIMKFQAPLSTNLLKTINKTFQFTHKFTLIIRYKTFALYDIDFIY